jgi:repressor LexA
MWHSVPKYVTTIQGIFFFSFVLFSKSRHKLIYSDFSFATYRFLKYDSVLKENFESCIRSIFLLFFIPAFFPETTMNIPQYIHLPSQNPQSPLTARQRQVLEIIQHNVQKSNIVPSLREISAALGISSLNGVRSHLEALERKGYIQRNNRFSRSITLLTGTSKERREIPVLGKISDCRLTIVSESEPIKLRNPHLNGRKDSFLIQFSDQSLFDEYAVRSGDYLLLRLTRNLKNEEPICITDGSSEVFIVRGLWNPQKKNWEFYSCGIGHEQINIVEPKVVGVIVTLLRFGF